MTVRWIFFLISSSLLAVAQPDAPKRAIKTKITPPKEGDVAPRVEIVPTPEEKVVPRVFSVEEAIPAPVKALAEPALTDFPGGIVMAVTATSEKAQGHVTQGLNFLLGGWDFQASRHFAAAMREDPECLLAQWGMVMTALAPTPETNAARDAGVERMLDLVDQGKGTELERGYGYALIQYVQQGPAGAAGAFNKVAEHFPNEMMAAIFSALFDRTGYDELGTATPAQEAAENALLALMKRFPKSPLPIYALLTIRAEGPDLTASLPLAQQLCQMAPSYPPYYHLLGHYAWRCGEHAKAATAFGKASSFFQAWMKENNATLADCAEWVKSECYRAVCMASKGDFENAYATARQLAATPVPPERPTSAGAKILLWDAKSLPARLLLQHGPAGTPNEALASLPTPQDIKKYHSTSLCYWWLDGLRFALEARRLIDAKDLPHAADVSTALTQHGEAMSKTQAAATANGERSEWVRSFRALEVLASDVRGRIALAGTKAEIGSAYNWFSSAADRQRHAPALFAPLILTPLPLRIGDYFLAVNRPADAVEAYQRALAFFPNHMETLLALKRAYEQSKQPELAKETATRIAQLKAE